MGTGILGRAVFQAYRQAIANASKTGVAQEAMQNAVRKAGKAINEQEARQILGVTEQTSWEEILKLQTLSLCEKMSLGSRRAADSWILSNLECDLTQNSLLLFIDRTYRVCNKMRTHH
ncbi:hypothetical protein DY000_02032255 [Brassica cretica]|uniref:Uncharacterized protein n=1 Tax=Brassica cretica TaxID=69181 RepID=A0ABQ7DVQ2_BRACR|nr:hypothetical protein DY000_02032255 [Brassica cretica]